MRRVVALLAGNIPAYAGKAMAAGRPAVHTGKHPRIRGESRGAPLGIGPTPETSPHTRGKRLFFESAVRRHGNIPAYAGKAPELFLWNFNLKKHPRIRGESHNILNQ